jgi:hypothetical protein
MTAKAKIIQLLFVGVLVLAFCQAVSLASTTHLTGTMSSHDTFVDTVKMTVPAATRRLTANVPEPSDIEIDGYSQKVEQISVTSDLPPTTSGDVTDSYGNRYKVMSFQDPPPGTINIILKCTVSIHIDLTNSVPMVQMPLPDLTPDVAMFTLATRDIQTESPQILALAHSLANGAKTEADLCSNVAYWVATNSRYNLNDITDSSRDALSTLNRKTGVCDGYTNLFVALMRANGVPARFVGGIVLQGDLEYPADPTGEETEHVLSGTSPHSWAEVYFPGTGWVAYDPQQSIGFVDPHHVRLYAAQSETDRRSSAQWRTEGGGTIGLGETVTGTTGNDEINVACVLREKYPAGVVMAERGTVATK